MPDVAQNGLVPDVSAAHEAGYLQEGKEPTLADGAPLLESETWIPSREPL